jgi:hypothetical protein
LKDEIKKKISVWKKKKDQQYQIELTFHTCDLGNKIWINASKKYYETQFLINPIC